MAATASAALVAPVVDTSHAENGQIAPSASILPFLRLPRELRDQVRSQATISIKHMVSNNTRSTTMPSAFPTHAVIAPSASNVET